MRIVGAASFIAASCMLAPAVFADDSITIRNAWVRATVPGQRVAGAYLTLRSTTAARLTRVRTSVAPEVEIHEMSERDGVMRMRRLASLDLPAGREVQLAPGAIHLMLEDLKSPLRAGDEVELELITESDKKTPATTRIRVPVRKEAPQ